MTDQAQVLRAFVGPAAALARIVAVVPEARVFALRPGASALVLPLTDDVQAGLHAANGTGEWIDFECGLLPILLTTSDLAFAARASVRSALAFVAIRAAGDQIATAWIDGDLHMAPQKIAAGELRSRTLSPVNVALRHVGVVLGAGASGDESVAVGLDLFSSTEAIARTAHLVRV
jgi:hypothetical protein